MAFRYVGGERDQLFLMPVSMRDWLDEGHLAWFVLDVVEKVDTSGFHARYRLDGAGRPPYDPEMMLALLFYAYATGVRSSRRVEAACCTDAAFRVIAGGATPDHATIARFVADHEAAIEAVFVDVLRLCVAAGLVSTERLAVDGTKLSANAALDQNRDAQWIRSEVARILAEAIATDAAEDAQVGLLGFEDLPVELSSRGGRLARLEAALAQIEAQDAADQAKVAEQEAKLRAATEAGRQRNGRKPTKDPHAALARAEADHAVAAQRVAAHGAGRRTRAGQTGPRRGAPKRLQAALAKAEAAVHKARAAAAAASPAASRQANIVDPESRKMKTADGFTQGFNCQVAVNEHQVVVAHAVTQDGVDYHQLEPMMVAAQAFLDAAGAGVPIGVVLADAGYWSEHNATFAGPDRLIATQKDWKQRQVARLLGTTTGPPPEGASTLEAMEHRLRTPEGAAAYKARSCTVEPVFANGKENRGYRRFRRRGLAAARSEWSLINTVHNLGKLFSQRGPLAVT